MGNCLVTKLKERVDNDNLEPLGGMVVHYPQTSVADYSKRSLTIEASKNLTLKVRNGYFVNNTTYERIGTSMDYAPSFGVRGYTVDNTDCVIEISDKYALTRLVIGADGYTNLNVLKYSDGLSALSGFNSKNSCNLSSLSGKTFNQLTLGGDITGDATGISITNQLNIEDNQNVKGKFTILSSAKYIDIKNTSFNMQMSDFAPANELIRIQIPGTNITGNISSLYNKPSLTQVNLSNTSVAGTLEGFAENLWNSPNSKRSGSIILNLNGSVTTLNNTEYFSDKQVVYYLVFESDNIKLRARTTSGDIIATYNGSSWTYNI